MALKLSMDQPIIDPQDAAEQAGLTYVSDESPGIRRRKAGKGFRYVLDSGATLKDPAALARIKTLAIPPAWTNVWICPKATGHIQATGRDAKGRKQYRYHDRFREVRDSTKYDHMMAFARSLPAIRRKVDEHLRLKGLPREKVLATIVQLLETTLARVGNDDYAKQNKSYGLTTLRRGHAKVEGSQLRLMFKGKGGKLWRLGVRDRRIAKVVRSCQELPGQELFQYVDEAGATVDVTSTDVNEYLREISGQDITAKDFRTWHGTVLASLALQELEQADNPTGAKRNIKAAIAQVAARLGNTPTICRKCYVHPAVIDTYVEGSLLLECDKSRVRAAGLKPEERAVLALLQSRLATKLKAGRSFESQLRASARAARQKPSSGPSKGRRRMSPGHAK